MVQYSPIFIIEGHCQAWFQRSRASANYHRLTYASPTMYASQGDSLGVFQGSFSWFQSFQARCSKSSRVFLILDIFYKIYKGSSYKLYINYIYSFLVQSNIYFYFQITILNIYYNGLIASIIAKITYYNLLKSIKLKSFTKVQRRPILMAPFLLSTTQ